MVANWIFTASNGCQLDIHSQQRLLTGYLQPALVANWQPWHFSQSKVFVTGCFPNYLTTLTISEDAFLLVASLFFCQPPKVNYNQHWWSTGFIASNDGCTPISFPPTGFNTTHNGFFKPTAWLPTGFFTTTDGWSLFHSLQPSAIYGWQPAVSQH